MSQLTRLDECVYVHRDIVNVGIITNTDTALLIDFGSGSVLRDTAELGIRNIKIVVCTHHHRDQVQGLGAFQSTLEGADTAIYLSTLPDDGPTGGFFRDRAPIQW